ncbi:2-succinylbenzoate--CoA ligase [Oscillatoria acuminata]|uniref:Acyl-CoA synthetase (AMP-forming)/AMP-acid ligase II n=1 Tax=Oscillatoria acuminata PCC 6304 TaxID=56110 RepID=K9THD0_9CYAN|nr:2-succinylbenzoate--CoA ligase [Oscillatoria acuminata]AFY81556.1 acyl-CoA synthetase (AMP-forming)/AMP-acid ligase II [Oscillatoria acuminata PCC 6304]
MVEFFSETFPKIKPGAIPSLGWQKSDLIAWMEAETGNLGRAALSVFSQLNQSQISPILLLAERDPVRFLAGFLAAVAADCPLFLGNPNWIDREWQSAIQQIQPDRIWHQGQDFPGKACQTPRDTIPSGIMIPTGGSSGQLRFAIHTWETLMASVAGFTEYFQLHAVNSCCVLPLFHVSGLMQFLRSFTTGGTFINVSYSQTIVEQTASKINPKEFFISLVPTQLNRLLATPESADYLARFQTVLLGGAPAWPELLERARQCQISLSPTYGMTETASQIVTLKPEEFLAGNQSCGRLLPHAKITITNAEGEVLEAGKTGMITIQADSLAKGYYPGENLAFTLNRFQSDDLGFMDEAGYLTVVGRHSDKIISGGENIYPAEVEAAILGTGLVEDVCAIALPDPDWGQVVTAVYVPKGGVESEAIASLLTQTLSPFKRPKYWVQIDSLPRNNRGKISRRLVEEMVLIQLKPRLTP